ncbi:hypothetical protein DIZ27_25925 [Streptomyces sp. NWU339]|uniref:hypothetical protein n=1 Tax=Streptomyces sp. NWU339 TaxID=2185284 RepID=UPI000D674F79|nr:hypothetical protein [Streptomyces sp. NWU339]PWI07870.1 hypothetical protein DIZ27_25925 [Streptomyces sp. NWU339]
MRTTDEAAPFGGPAARADRIAAYPQQKAGDRPGVRVADRVVAGWPDETHGDLVRAGIALCDDRDPRAPHQVLDVLDPVAARADEHLAHFERICLTESLDAVPRTPTGKPARRPVHRRLRQQAAC